MTMNLRFFSLLRLQLAHLHNLRLNNFFVNVEQRNDTITSKMLCNK